MGGAQATASSRLTTGAGLLGGLTLGMSIALLLVMPSSASLAPGWKTPIIALELATSWADLAFIVGEDASQMRAAFRLGQTLDHVFPFLYGGLIGLISWAHVQRRTPLHLGVVVVVTVVVIAGDHLENAAIADVMTAAAAGGNDTSVLGPLQLWTWTKWGAIACALAVAARHLGARHGVWGVVCIAPLLPTALAMTTRTAVWGEVMAGLVSLAIGLLSLLALYDGAQQWREKRPS